jgi:hypothetical protein
VKQRLCKRLAELERVNEIAARRARATLAQPEMEKAMAWLEKRAADPQLQQLLAESPIGFLGMRVRELRAELRGRAYSAAQIASGCVR